MAEEDWKLSKEQIAEKYPRGSPDYPSHANKCECSGCFASWLEWRAQHAAYVLGEARGERLERERIVAWLQATVNDWFSRGTVKDIWEAIERREHLPLSG